MICDTSAKEYSTNINEGDVRFLYCTATQEMVLFAFEAYYTMNT